MRVTNFLLPLNYKFLYGPWTCVGCFYFSFQYSVQLSCCHSDCQCDSLVIVYGVAWDSKKCQQVGISRIHIFISVRINKAYVIFSVIL